jgi:hypothetical protein
MTDRFMVSVAIPESELEADELVDWIKSYGIPAELWVTDKLEVAVPAAHHARAIEALKAYNAIEGR